MNVKTNVKAGDGHTFKWGPMGLNHNQTQALERLRGFTVKTGVKAGPIEVRELVIKATI